MQLKHRVDAIAGQLPHLTVARFQFSAGSCDLAGSDGRTPQRLAAEFEARLRYTGIDEILEDGLHRRLTEFIEGVRELAGAVQSSYLEVV